MTPESYPFCYSRKPRTIPIIMKPLARSKRVYSSEPTRECRVAPHGLGVVCWETASRREKSWNAVQPRRSLGART